MSTLSKPLKLPLKLGEYRVFNCSISSLKKEGLRFEVITVGEDGGPICLAICYKKEDAENICSAMNLIDKL